MNDPLDTTSLGAIKFVQPGPSKPCDVCGQTLSRHDTGAGIPICPGIYAPGYRTRLGDQIEALTAENERLREALTHARNAFQAYAGLHRNKGTAEGIAKAQFNEALAATMDAALNAHPKRSEPQQ